MDYLFQSLNNLGPGIRSYADALRVWTEADRWRGSNEDDERKLRKGDRRHFLGIRKEYDDSIVIRYHNTDVVTWYPDNTVEINAYPSLSTNALVGSKTPWQIVLVFHRPEGIFIRLAVSTEDEDIYRWARKSRWYEIKHTHITLYENDEGLWEPTNSERDTDLFEHIFLDRKLTREARLKWRLREFEAWVTTAVSLGLRMRKEDQFNHGYPDTIDTMNLLKDQEHWSEIVRYSGFWGDRSQAYQRYDASLEPTTVNIINRVIRHVREVVYQWENCYQLKTYPYLDSWDAVKRAKDSLTKKSYIRRKS